MMNKRHAYYPLMVVAVGDPNKRILWAVQYPEGDLSSLMFSTAARAEHHANAVMGVTS